MTPTILAAILSLLPARADRALEAERLAPFAESIEVAVAVAPELPFRGPEARLGAALALVAIAWHESNFAAEVLDCRKRGAAGDVTAFQLLGKHARGGYTVEELCASPVLAAGRAVAVLTSAARACPRAPASAAFQGYASGRCGRPAPIRVWQRGELVVIDPDGGMTRCRTWERLAKFSGLEVSCVRMQEVRRSSR
jgi:hypothetical protein